jgi:hypothetical protein
MVRREVVRAVRDVYSDERKAENEARDQGHGDMRGTSCKEQVRWLRNDV